MGRDASGAEARSVASSSPQPQLGRRTSTYSHLLASPQLQLDKLPQLDDRLLAGRVLALARHEQARAAVHRTRDAPRVTDEGSAYSQPHA
jgi:hypothetical protein